MQLLEQLSDREWSTPTPDLQCTSDDGPCNRPALRRLRCQQQACQRMTRRPAAPLRMRPAACMAARSTVLALCMLSYSVGQSTAQERTSSTSLRSSGGSTASASVQVGSLAAVTFISAAEITAGASYWPADAEVTWTSLTPLDSGVYPECIMDCAKAPLHDSVSRALSHRLARARGCLSTQNFMLVSTPPRSATQHRFSFTPLPMHSPS